MIMALQYSLEQEIKIIQLRFMFLDHKVEDNIPSGLIINNNNALHFSPAYPEL